MNEKGVTIIKSQENTTGENVEDEGKNRISYTLSSVFPSKEVQDEIMEIIRKSD